MAAAEEALGPAVLLKQDDAIFYTRGRSEITVIRTTGLIGPQSGSCRVCQMRRQ